MQPFRHKLPDVSWVPSQTGRTSLSLAPQEALEHHTWLPCMTCSSCLRASSICWAPPTPLPIITCFLGLKGPAVGAVGGRGQPCRSPIVSPGLLEFMAQGQEEPQPPGGPLGAQKDRQSLSAPTVLCWEPWFPHCAMELTVLCRTGPRSRQGGQVRLCSGTQGLFFIHLKMFPH